MKIAAGLIGILLGFISLIYVGLFGGLIGSAAGFLGSFNPEGNELSSWASTVKTLSYVAPLLLLAGGAVTFARPSFGGVLLAFGAVAHWYLLGFGVLGNIFILPSVLAAVLAFSAARKIGESNTAPASDYPTSNQGAASLGTCGGCGQQNAPSARFCGGCGAPLAKPQPIETPAASPTALAATIATPAEAITHNPPTDLGSFAERWRQSPLRVRAIIIGFPLVFVACLIAGRLYYAAHPVTPLPVADSTPPPNDASFACRSATTWSERAVCADTGLAAQDKILATLYSQNMATHTSASERRGLRLEQRLWLREREGCATAGSPLVCVQELYVSRIAALKAALSSSVEPSRAAAVSTTYTDPISYCRAVRTINQPGKSYRGMEAPDWMLRQMGVGLDQKIVNGVGKVSWPLVWRCYHGAVLACVEGGSHPICGPKSSDRRGPKEFWDYCRANPNASFLPGFVDGGYTIYTWACNGSRPIPTRVIYQVDERGFPLGHGLWKKLSPATVAVGLPSH